MTVEGRESFAELTAGVELQLLDRAMGDFLGETVTPFQEESLTRRPVRAESLSCEVETRVEVS